MISVWTEDSVLYAVPYLDDERLVHKIGVNISSESRTVEERIEA